MHPRPQFRGPPEATSGGILEEPQGEQTDKTRKGIASGKFQETLHHKTWMKLRYETWQEFKEKVYKEKVVSKVLETIWTNFRRSSLRHLGRISKITNVLPHSSRKNRVRKSTYSNLASS